MSNCDDFSPVTIRDLQKRAAFICSNPSCRSLTIAPSCENEEDYIYIGIASHITASALKGPRYDPDITSKQRRSIANGIFLCSSCAIMIDKNNGQDFSVALLREWKKTHEEWIRANLNKNLESITEVSGTHIARGVGKITSLDISKPARIKPGTISIAEGVGEITATKIK